MKMKVKKPHNTLYGLISGAVNSLQDIVTPSINQTMKYFSTHRRLFDNDTAKKKRSMSISELHKRTILVSNLRMHTVKADIYDYFNGKLKAKVTHISFNSLENKYYNKSCLVTFCSIKTAKRVRKLRSHQIHGVQVTVERYLGKEKHQAFRRGEHNLFLKGINEVYILHRLCEDVAVRCGPHSGIDFLRDGSDGQHNGEVVISFYDQSHRDKALKIITGEYNLDAGNEYWHPTLSESVDQVDQD